MEDDLKINSAQKILLLYPGQPVADLESYMQSLEKKSQSIDKMVETLDSISGDVAKKLHVR